MKKIFYTMMAMAVMCFVSCTEKNVPSDEEKSGGSSTETGSISANMEDYVGTWLFEGDANLMGMICIQLKSDGTGTYFDGGFTYGSWSVTKEVWAEQEFVRLYIEGSKTTNNGNSTYTRNMSYGIKILEMGKDKIKASDIVFNNIFYLVRTTDDAINNYSEE